jgi:golgi pH regulator
MLLFLAQLLAVYLVTSLIALPSSDRSTTDLLDTLPDFAVFSRLFDCVFLVAASAWFAVRWLERKIRVDIVDGYEPAPSV